ncbi:MAG: sulfite exporter TauE/SafE family protein [Flavobacteriaceae bacterium]
MLYSALILGLLGSLHCLGMCGPIAFMLPVDRSSKYKTGIQTFIYHSGRLLAYGILGLLFGLLGKGLNIFGAQQKLSIFIGGLMILLVLIPFHKISKIQLAQPVYKLVSYLKNALGASFKKKTADAFLTIGFLNGFLPCGLVYMALLGATAMAGPELGFVYMVVFGLGTIPLMTVAVFFSSVIKSSVKNKIRRFVPVFVVIIGLLFILRGMGLGIPYVSPKVAEPMAASAVECHQP